jgi:hypothetical protein
MNLEQLLAIVNTPEFFQNGSKKKLHEMLKELSEQPEPTPEKNTER